MRHAVMILSLAMLAACGGSKPDYAASARCQEMGHKTGTPGYEQCLKDERAARMLREQREEFERMKQDERDWKTRRY